MRFVRIAAPDAMTFAVLEGEGIDPAALTVKAIADTPFTAPQYTGAQWPLPDVRLLAPMLPSKIVAITPRDNGTPTLLIKPPTSVTGPASVIRAPRFAGDLKVAGHIALVVGQPCKDVAADDWQRVVRGATVAIAVKSAQAEAEDGHAARAGAFDTFCPLGPWLETDLSFLNEAEVTITTRAGETVRKRTLEFAAEDAGDAVALASETMTLLPGDVILFGGEYLDEVVPPRSVVDCQVSGIGTLVAGVAG